MKNQIDFVSLTFKIIPYKYITVEFKMCFETKRKTNRFKKLCICSLGVVVRLNVKTNKSFLLRPKSPEVFP